MTFPISVCLSYRDSKVIELMKITRQDNFYLYPIRFYYSNNSQLVHCNINKYHKLNITK